jgi:hypothetical protein
MTNAAGDVYGKRTLVYVIVSPQIPIKYGFPTNMEASDRQALGHASAIGAGGYVSGIVFGANAPKPATARRFTASKGYQSSFINAGNYQTAAQAGWSIGRAKIRRGGKTPKMVAVYVTIGTIKYAWLMHKRLYENSTLKADMAKLGIKLAGGEKDLVWGARYPTPPTAQYRAVGTQGVKTLSTQFDPSKADNLPTGWSIVSEKV